VALALYYTYDMDQEPDKEPLGPPQLPKASKFTPLTTVQPKLNVEELTEDEDHLNEHVDYPGDPDGLVAEEKQRKWQTEHLAASQSQPQSTAKSGKRKARWLTVPLILILIAAAAYGAYWFGSKQADKNSDKSHPAQQANGQAKPHTTTEKQAATTPTKHYDSATYTLGFDYPETWKVNDTAAKLMVASPAVSLTTAGGSKVEGHVVLTIQNQQTTIPSYPANGAVAILASEKLTYKQPTPVQRAQTYFSYLGYGTKSGGLDALYITGDNGYQKDQNIPMSDVVKGNPLIGITFQSCTSVDCSTGTPTMLTVVASDWPTTAESKQVVDLIKSLQLN
jgi:hypothetical protein